MPDFGRWTSPGGDPSLNEINRTDRFIEALSTERPVYSTDPEEAELAHLLAGWRDSVRQAPMSGIVTPRDAVAALNRGTARNRTRVPLALVGSVAAAVLCLGGFGAAVYGAGPGDALYGVRGVLFGEHVTRDVQVELASTELEQVQQLIDQGQWQEAQEKLQTITTTVATVNDEQQKQQLVNQWQELSVKVENRDPEATVPPDAPPVVLPEVTVTTSPTSEPTTTPTTSGSDTMSPSSPTSSESPTSPASPTTPTSSVPPTTPTSSEPPTTPTSSEPTSPTASTPPTSQPPSTSEPTATSSPARSPSPSSPTESSAAVELPPPSSAPTPVPSTPPEVSPPASEPTAEPTTAEPTVVPEPAHTTTIELPSQEAPARGGQGRGDSGRGGSDGDNQRKQPQLTIEMPALPGFGAG